MLEFDLSTTSKRVALPGELAKYGPGQTHTPSLRQAQAYCRRWSAAHPENFIVASLLLPRSLKQDFHNLYAFCRWSDDLADETHDSRTALELLDWWQAELERCVINPPRHPILLALRQTIERHHLDLAPFRQLLSAFRQDQHVQRYADDQQLLDYCGRSANPVGRILLQLARAVTPASVAYSDAICSGLQLANFCQDMSRDAERGRIYLPRSRWCLHGVDEAMLLRRQATPELRSALSQWVQLARGYLLEGWPLVRLVPRWLKTDIDLFVRGGLAILQAIEARQFDVWTHRPRLTKVTQAKLMAKSLLRPTAPLGLDSPVTPNIPLNLSHLDWQQPSKSAATAKLNHLEPESKPLRDSRRRCVHICRDSQSSFYNSFALLEPPRRQAMCALYAFARITDDLADNPQPPELRTAHLESWRTELWQHCQPQPSPASQHLTSQHLTSEHLTSEHVPIWPALARCAANYNIPLSLLDGIITGVQLDVQHKQPADWQELHHYCYHVASTVGLACTHIWHSPERGPIPTQAAIDCGTAFQLTNILRDIGQDAQTRRIYVPQPLFDKYSIDNAAWLAGQPTGDWRSMLDEVAQRAEQLYRAGWPTIHVLSPRSQRMFSLMWHSYRDLLNRLMANKERLWTGQKLVLPKRQRLRLLAMHTMAPSRLLVR